MACPILPHPRALQNNRRGRHWIASARCGGWGELGSVIQTISVVRFAPVPKCKYNRYRDVIGLVRLWIMGRLRATSNLYRYVAQMRAINSDP
jgi:hypothetical protein